MPGFSEEHAAHAALVEEVMQQGPEFYLCRELHHICEVARASGLTRDEVSVGLIIHAVSLVRPDVNSRSAFASLLRREARKLAVTDREFIDW